MDSFQEFANTLQEMDDALSTSIKITHGQALKLVVDDLVEKYKFNVERGDKEWAAAFEKVLRYYLDEQEMSSLISESAKLRSD